MPLLNDTLLSDVALKTLHVLSYEADLSKQNGLTVSWGMNCEEVTGYTILDLKNPATLRKMFGQCFQDWVYNLTVAATKNNIQEWTHTLHTRADSALVSHRISPLGNGKVMGCMLCRGSGKNNIAAKGLNDSGEEDSIQGNFISAISHEIRTPMNVIVGISHLALSTTQDPMMRNYLKKIDQSATSLMALLSDIMDYSKIDVGQMQLENDCFRVEDIMNQLKIAFSPMTVEKRLSLVVEVSEDVPKVVKGDPLRISQVLTNLLGNALLFTEHGTVRMHCALAKANNKFMILRFTVQDNSKGMTTGQLEENFTAFHQTDNATTMKYGGTGLGLSISRKLAEVLGGGLTAASTPEGTLQMIFTCRVERETGSDERDGGFQNIVPKFQGQTILVVEDNATNREIATALIEAANLKAVCADNGQTALNILNKKEYKDLFSLILMDLQMPVMDGYQATEAIRSNPRWNTVPIIAVTAYTSEAERKCCLRNGMQGHLPKPIDATVFYGLLKKYIGKPFGEISRE